MIELCNHHISLVINIYVWSRDPDLYSILSVSYSLKYQYDMQIMIMRIGTIIAIINTMDTPATRDVYSCSPVNRKYEYN